MSETPDRRNRFRSRDLVAIDLFAGGGGLTLGLKLAGFHVLGAVEIDDLAAETYLRNHPEVEMWQQDIRLLDEKGFRRALGLRKHRLDVLAGCPPCQGFSTLTTKNGARTVNDARNLLVWEFVRFVTEFKPKVVMLENVPGLANDPEFHDVVRELQALNYTVEFRILNSARFGVPQRRRRLILLAGLYGPVPFADEAETPEVTVRDAIGMLPEPGDSGDPLHDLPENRSERVRRIIRTIPLDGGSRSDLPEDLTLDCHRRGNGFKDVYGRMAWDAVAPTITGGCVNPSKGRFLHPSQPRTITLREAAILQGFPRDYRFSLRKGKYAAAVVIGNALPPEFIRLHAIKVKQYVLQRHLSKKGGDRTNENKVPCSERETNDRRDVLR